MTNAVDITIERLSTADQMAPLAAAWNTLSRGVPFRSFEWADSWWRAYGLESGKQLFVLAAFDSRGDLTALAPWYLERSIGEKRTIRFLGSGEVCSDYLAILCRPQAEESVADALAGWLCGAGDASAAACPRWDLLELGGAHEHDGMVKCLVASLARRGNLIHRRARSSCWRVHLPSDWNAYLATLSKSHRKQIRRLDNKYFSSGQAQLHIAQSPAELRHGLEILSHLHQRRRQSLGERGCFSSTRFAQFHGQTAARLLAVGQLRLVWLDILDRTVAAEYQVLGNGVVYAYQSGIEPEALAHEPGRLITLATLRLAIEEGRHAFDFLRGDESYKAHWRAQPRPVQEIRVVANRTGARLRHKVWLAGGNVKHWLKKGLSLTKSARWPADQGATSGKRANRITNPVART